MIETGTVSEVRGDRIVVGCGSEACKSCSSGFCETSKRVFEAVNEKGLQVSPGDTVEVYLSTGKTIAAGFFALIVPLILFVAMYLVSASVVPGGGDGVRALFGLAGIGIGFGLSVLYGKLRPGRQYPAVVSVRRGNGLGTVSGESVPVR